jgi:hypothetical protein
MSDRVFAKYDKQSFGNHFLARLELKTLVGGTPSDSKVATGWLKSKLQEPDDRIREMVAEVMVERNISADEAASVVNDMKNLNGFKRIPETGQLFIEGRQVKAAMKEAASCAVAAGKIEMTGWGKTRKWLKGFFPEHVFVLEETVPLWRHGDNGEPEPVLAATDVLQQFVHTHRGSSIQYQEYVSNCYVDFTVITDHPFTTKDWAMLWTSGELQGLGASRSQGYGTYAVTRWEQIAKQPTQIAMKKAKEAAGDTEDDE